MKSIYIICYWSILNLFSLIPFLIDAKHSVQLSNYTNEPNCTNLLKPNPTREEIKLSEEWKMLPNESYNDNRFIIEIQNNCDLFRQNQKYFLNLNKTEDENNMRIAFTLVVFKNSKQVERLLRTIYRPWNYYCVHIDLKANKEFAKAIGELVKCLNSKYNNIINTVNRVGVYWGQMSVLTADLNCMKELYEQYKDWKYLINLTGQEFPLKTNAELARILKYYKGANNLEGTYKRRNENRVPTVKLPIPIIWFKGSVHITANRAFIAFIFESPKAKLLLEALHDRQIPDEQYFATLNHNQQLRIPGSFIGDPEDNEFFTRYKNWGERMCQSQNYVNQICIWGVKDLSTIITVPHLFINKLYEDFQPATLRCLERFYYDKIEKEILTGHINLKESFYESLNFVKYRYSPPIE